ncbi:hypothetical protein [Rhizobium sp. 18055]|uniref:hypothetical protein n=1 Tax=Rhizobium sp. 18055 TaxID=2681403 RepID=UPI00135AEC42|nr:hypothetical protein [Rhizobium sp. 18055]
MTEFKRVQGPDLVARFGADCRETISEIAFTLASGIIDTMPFAGCKLDEKQERAWPRSGIFTDDGVEMKGIPSEIYDLCELLASHIEKGAEFDVFQLFHKIARIDRLFDWSKGTLQLPVDGRWQDIE